MSKRAVLGLFAVTIGLLLYIFLFERTSLTSKELQQRQGRALPTFVRDRLTALEITREGTKVALARVDPEQGDLSPWRMTSPTAVEADSDAVDQVLGELEWLNPRRRLAQVNREDLERFGLTKPRLRVAYEVAGERHVLAIGGADVHDESVYARVDEGPDVLVVPKTVVEVLDHPASHFRTKQFLGELTTAWVRRVERQRGDQTLVLTKEDDEWWVASEPKSYADEQAVRRLLDALDGLRAVRYLEPGAAPTGQPATQVRVRIVPDQHREDKAPRQVELQIFGACPGHEQERVARAGDQGDPVCVLKEDLAPFSMEAEALRRLRLLGIDPSQVEALNLRAGEAQVSVKRDGEKWLASNKKEVDREAVEAWLADMHDARAVAFEPAPADLRQTGSLSLSLAGDKKRQIVIGPARADDSVPVRRDQEPIVLILSPVDAQRLTPIPERFTTLALWPETKPSELVGIAAEVGAARRSLTLADGAWRLHAEGPEAADGASVRLHVKRLSELRALSRLGHELLPAYGLASPRASVRLRRTKGEALRLELGAESKRGFYARSQGGAVIEVAAEVLATIAALAGAEPPDSSLGGGGDERGDEHEHEHEHEDEHEHAD